MDTLKVAVLDFCLAEQLEVFLDVQLVADLGYSTDVWLVVRMDCGQVERMVALWDASLVVLMVNMKEQS